MSQILLIIVGLLLFVTFLGFVLRKYFCRQKETVVEQKQENNNNDVHIEMCDQEVIPESHQSQIHKQQGSVKTSKSTSTPNRKSKQKKEKQLIPDIAFQFNDDSDNENEKNSSGTDHQQSINIRGDEQGFNFEKQEQNLEELVTPTQVNSQEI